MGKNNVADLLNVDGLFTTQAERDEAQREKVVEIPLSEITDFPDHPFKVRMDEGMTEMAESVKQYGVLVPALVRPESDGGYEMIAGHRRKLACELAGLDTIPCIVREMTDDESTVIMVDSNLQREQLLPSEKAFAYKMKLDAMKRRGRRTDLTSSPVATKVDSAAEIGRKCGESRDQVFRYIRLTYLIPEILELVDNSVLKEKGMLQMAMRPAVELSYLNDTEQYTLLETMESEDCTPSHEQAIIITGGQAEPGCDSFYHAGGKTESGGTVSDAEGEDQQIFCSGNIGEEDGGDHCEGTGDVSETAAGSKEIVI